MVPLGFRESLNPQGPQPRLVKDSRRSAPPGSSWPADQGGLASPPPWGKPATPLICRARPDALTASDHRKCCPSAALPFSEICPQQPGGQGRQTSRCPHPWALPTSHKWFVPEFPWAEVTFLPQPQISYLSEQERWHQRYIVPQPRRARPAPTTACLLPTSHGACSPHHTRKCAQRVQAAPGREPSRRAPGQVGQSV